MIMEFVARQFRQPSGPLGHVWGWIMNRGNARIIAVAVDSLAIEPHHHVLEIGFGGGRGLELLLPRVPQGSVTATELSDVMLSDAEKRFADPIGDSRLRLVSAAVEHLPLDDATCDGVVTINTVYFWSQPLLGVAEILRVLKPGGCFVLAIRPSESMRRMAFTRHGFTIYEPRELEEMLERAGFTRVRSEAHDDGRLGAICIVAYRPASTA